MYRQLKKMVTSSNVKRGEYLKNKTTFRVGGKIKYYVTPQESIQLINVIRYLDSISAKYYVLGGGSNVLADDSGYDGVIVSTTKLKGIRFYEDYIEVMAGTMLGEVANYYCSHNIGGMEDSVGMPGTIGGAVVGNAGAYNFVMADMVVGVTVIKDGKVDYINCEKCGFQYRDSNLRDSAVISVDLKKKGNCDTERMDLVRDMRKSINIGYSSAGSIFKRQEGIVVSKLLDDMGYKGKSVGGAKVSEKHAGYIINYNNASSQDIITLIETIKNEVKESTGILLEEEIKYIK